MEKERERDRCNQQLMAKGKQERRSVSQNNASTNGDEAVAVARNSNNESSLVSWHEVPSWLQYNRFIHTGYRPLLPSRLQALLSIVQWHNETMNIHTHFLPMFFFIYLFCDELYRTHHSEKGEPHRVLYLFAAAGCVFVCAVSTAYHSLMCSCRSADSYHRLICIDIFGSVVVISTTAVPLLLFGNPCLSSFTVAWMLALFGVSTAVTAFAIFQRSMTAAQRFLLFGGHLLLRLGLQFFTLMPKYRATGHHASLALHSSSFLWLLLGGMVNIGRFPERFFSDPASSSNNNNNKLLKRSWIASVLDYVGNSHNIWHVMSIYSCYLTFLGVGADYEEFTHFHKNANELLKCDWR